MIRTGGVGQPIANIGGVPVLDQTSWLAGAGVDAAGSSSPLSDGIITWAVVQKKHTVRVPCVDFSLVYAYMGAYEHAATTSTPQGGVPTGQATVHTTIWKQPTNPGTGGVPIDVLFNGSSALVVQPEELVVSDAITGPFVAGDTVFERTLIQVASGVKWPLGTKGLLPGDADGMRSGTGAGPSTDYLHTGTVPLGAGPSWTHFHAVSSSSLTAAVTTPVLAFYGTSIAEGYNSNSNGHQAHLVIAANAENVPVVRLARGGESARLLKSTGNHEMRDAIAAQATDIVCEHLTNDFKNSLNFTDCATQLRTVHSHLAAIGGGRRVWQMTGCPSYNGSTDGWATVAGQTPNAADGVRVATNDWIRAGCPESVGGVPVAPGTPGAVPSPYIYGFIEVADLAESARGSGKWKAGYSNDGIHPASTGHNAIAADLSMTGFFTAMGATPPAPPPPPVTGTGIPNLQVVNGQLVRLV